MVGQAIKMFIFSTLSRQKKKKTAKLIFRNEIMQFYLRIKIFCLEFELI